MNTKVATAQRGVTWVELILDIEVGSENAQRFPYAKRSYISSLLSRDIKLKCPEREFTTRKEDDTLVVTRTK